MMKKLLLLLAICSTTGIAFGQQNNNSSIVMQPVNGNSNTPEATYYTPQMMMKDRAERTASRAAAKGTLSGKRSHNFLDYLIAAGNTPSGTFPYMWYGADMFGIYGDGSGGTVLDTIQFVSYGSVLMPWHQGFNDALVPGAAGKIYINNFNAYTVDSVYFYGFYGRNPAKTSIVDTMIVSLVWGDNIRSFQYYSANIKTNFGYDTIRVATIRFDQAKQTADTYSTGNPNVVTLKIPMNTATTNDTTSNGLEIVRAAFNQSIPAGDLVAVTATFKTGESYTPWSDTVFRGSVNPNVPFKYNMWRPAIYGQNAQAYPTYTPGNWNGGVFKSLPDTVNGYGGWYVPGFAYLSADSDLEYPDIDFILSCANCNAVDVANIPQQIANFGAYPNPAQSKIDVSFGLTTATDVTISLTNTVGQVVATQKMANVKGGTATFDVSNLSNGIYIYSIEAEGVQKTGRVVVAH